MDLWKVMTDVAAYLALVNEKEPGISSLGKIRWQFSRQADLATSIQPDDLGLGSSEQCTVLLVDHR